MGVQGLTWKQAKELFRYDATTGRLLWYCRRKGVRPGKPAGFLFNGAKYVTVNGRRVLVKKLVYLLCTGRQADKTLYHVDGDVNNCAFENLTFSKRNGAHQNGEIRILPKGRRFEVYISGRKVAETEDREKVCEMVRALVLY